MKAIFERILSNTDATVRLCVPTDILKAFRIGEGAHKLVFHAIDNIGKTWRFELATRTMGDRPKPELTRGSWLPFVKEKGLQVDDKIILSRDEEVDGAMFRIQALRKLPTNIFGRDVWVSIEDWPRYQKS